MKKQGRNIDNVHITWRKSVRERSKAREPQSGRELNLFMTLSPFPRHNQIRISNRASERGVTITKIQAVHCDCDVSEGAYRVNSVLESVESLRKTWSNFDKRKSIAKNREK